MKPFYFFKWHFYIIINFFSLFFMEIWILYNQFGTFYEITKQTFYSFWPGFMFVSYVNFFCCGYFELEFIKRYYYLSARNITFERVRNKCMWIFAIIFMNEIISILLVAYGFSPLMITVFLLLSEISFYFDYNQQFLKWFYMKISVHFEFYFECHCEFMNHSQYYTASGIKLNKRIKYVHKL